MLNFQSLSRQGRGAAKFRGHSLSKLTQTRFGARPAWSAQCERCHAFLSITTNPAPNEIAVGGAAVAINCPRP